MANADYDAGELTDREKQAGSNQIAISKQNVADIRNQLGRQLETYDLSNKQNRALADVQAKQAGRKHSSERFEAQRDLQNGTLGLLGSMGQAMNGSSIGNLMRMLENRNDKENNTFWTQYQTNLDQIENAYQESLNQNQMAKRDAITNAEKAIRDVEGNLSANLNNINPNLFVEPGTGDTDMSSGTVWSQNKKNINPNLAVLSGYLMPNNRNGATRNKLRGGDYFSKLINGFNGR